MTRLINFPLMQIYSLNSIAVLAFESGADYPRLTRTVIGKLREHLTTIERGALFSGAVIAANSKSFATGAELEEISSLDGLAARDFARVGQKLFQEIALFPVPVVAAVRGFCLGGAFDLALACHHRVATYDASFGHPGAALGLMTGWGGTQRLPRLLGKSAALQILISGERIPATQAYTLGLADELVSSSELVEHAALHAERLSVAWGLQKTVVQ
jgi:enoyl-CoA hydratase